MIAPFVVLIEGLGAILYQGAKTTPWWEGTHDKAFWAYLQLLVVPVAIAIGATAINWMQSERARKAEDAQQERDRVAEEASRQRELEVADRRAQADALQAYLDKMGQLLLDKNRPLRQSGTDSEVSILARAQTLTMLTRLDAKGKRSVLQFLYESRLIEKGHVVVALRQADLREADLGAANFHRADLSDADLIKAYLGAADLSDADLSEARLSLLNRSAYLVNLKSAKYWVPSFSFSSNRLQVPDQSSLVSHS